MYGNTGKNTPDDKWQTMNEFLDTSFHSNTMKRMNTHFTLLYLGKWGGKFFFLKEKLNHLVAN